MVLTEADAAATPIKAKQAHYVYKNKKILNADQAEQTEILFQEIIGTSRFPVRIKPKWNTKWLTG